MKRKILFSFVLIFLSIKSFSQGSSIGVGDEFFVGEVENNNYKFIDFPRDNFILKRGGIVDYKKIKGKKVEVIDVRENKDGGVDASIRLSSNKSFFNSHRVVTVDILEALREGELSKLKL